MREIVICKSCKEEFYDQWNLICLSALNMCLLCANKNDIKEKIFD